MRCVHVDVKLLHCLQQFTALPEAPVTICTPGSDSTDAGFEEFSVLSHTHPENALCCSGGPASKSRVVAADLTKPALLDIASQSSLQQSEALPGDCQDGHDSADSHTLWEPASAGMTSNSLSLPDQQSPGPARVQAQGSEHQSQGFQQMGSAVGLHDSKAASELPLTTAAAVNTDQRSAPAQQAAAPEEAPDGSESTDLVDSDVATAVIDLSPSRTGTAQAMDSNAVQQPAKQSPAGAKNVAAEMLLWLDATLATKKPSPGNGSRALQVQ